MGPGAFSPPCWPGSPPGCSGEVARIEEGRQELVRARASEPTPPLIEQLSQAQLPSVTRCAPELQSVEILGHDVGCHLELRVGSNQQ